MGKNKNTLWWVSGLVVDAALVFFFFFRVNDTTVEDITTVTTEEVTEVETVDTTVFDEPVAGKDKG